MENNNTQVIQPGTHFRITQGRVVNKKRILVNRTMEFTKVSKAPGMVNGFLTNEKNGQLLRTEISIPLDLLEVIEDGILTYPVEQLMVG